MTAVGSEQEATRIFEELLAQGAWWSGPLKAFGLPNCLRISTGSDEDNQLCVEALRRTYATNTGASHRG